MSDDARAGAGTQSESLRLMWWLVLPVLLVLAVLTVVQYRQRLADAERGLLRRADAHAQDLLSLAQPAMAHVEDLRRLLELNWDEPPALASGPQPVFDALRHPAERARIDGWTLDAAPPAVRDLYGQIWWGSREGEHPDNLWLRRAALFQRMARVAHDRGPGFVGSFFVSLERNVSWSYPWVNTPQMLVSMGVDSLAALDRLRIESFEWSAARRAREGDRSSAWGRPYVSQLDGQLVQSFFAGVVSDGRFRGEVSVDIRLDVLQHMAARWQTDGTQVWVADRELRLVADGQQPLKAPSGVGLANQGVEVPLAGRLPAEASPAWVQALHRLETSTLIPTADGVLVASARRHSPWIVVQAVPSHLLRNEVLPSLVPNGLLGLALLIVFVWGQWLFSRWFVQPSLHVLGHLRALTADPGVAPPDLGPRWQGWIQAVRETVLGQHAAREQLDRQREAMRHSEKLSVMGTLLAGVAHELNNPLSVVMGRAVLLEDRVLGATDADSEAARAVRDDARRIREAAERCGRIVRTFLNMARQAPPVRRRLKLADVVRSAADMLAHSLRSHGIRLTIDIPASLPEVHADPDRLGQVVLNLMVNAQQALQAVSRERLLFITAGVDEFVPGPAATPQVWLRVADSGHGVPDRLRDRLFEPFFTTKDAGSGTGLGLSMSRAMAREHGGELDLESSTAQGSCFRLCLPIAGDPGPVDGWVDASERASAETPEAGRVLVVDDESEVAEVTRSLLETLGYEVAVAESAEVARELLREARFDFVVADLRVPQAGDLSLCRTLRQHHPALARRTLLITGDTLSSDERRRLEDTGCPSLEKPFSREELREALLALQRDGGTSVAAG